MDTPTKEEIKTWVDKKDDGYMWLAKELAVSYQTVRAWMSTRAIPQKKLERIAELMRSPEEEQKTKAFAIMMLESDYKACERAAYNAGVSLVDWATYFAKTSRKRSIFIGGRSWYIIRSELNSTFPYHL